MIGNYLAGIWRMPDHAWKISLMIGTCSPVRSLSVCSARFKYGPDLAGGITLIYEMQDAPHASSKTRAATAEPTTNKLDQQIKSGGREFSLRRN